MRDTISRRNVLAGAAGLGAAQVLGIAPAIAGQAAKPVAAGDARLPVGGVPEARGLKLFTSIDGVKLFGMQKFSFPWPEPAVEFAGLHFAFEILTFENAYAVDPTKVRLERQANALIFTATGFTWAGGQEKHPGRLIARLERRADGAIRWSVETDFDRPVKSVKTIVRGLPRGRFSMGANDWQELGDIDVKAEYPLLAGGMATPLVAIEAATDKRVWGISAIQHEVRPTRFLFQPGPDAYRTELIYEQAGWQKTGAVKTHIWEIVTLPDFAALAERHFTRLGTDLGIPADLQSRPDAPAWMKHVALVLTLHGMHWSGFIFNDYARQLEILKWVARQIDPRNVLAFLPAWDGRYYWNYPRYEVDARMGGEAGFRRLMTEGRKLGFRFAPMYGSNVANPRIPEFAGVRDAVAMTINDFPMTNGEGVDWDGDRSPEPLPFMNLAVPSYRNHMVERISHMISTYGADAYFLDLCGTWDNNPQGDMLLGLKAMVDELARRHPGVAPIGEMLFDAQMPFVPMTHVGRFYAHKGYFGKREAVFSHLIASAPGKGSTGVHEAGFGYPSMISEEQGSIPTAIFVDDTFSDYRKETAEAIARAKRRFAKRGGLT